MNRSLSVVFASLFAVAPVLAAPVSLPPDTPTPANGIVSVCTGIGSDARLNPAWNAYPLKVAVAGKDGQYLGDVVVTIGQGGKELLSVDCTGPWLLFKLAPGAYRVGAESGGVKLQSSAHVAAKGQAHVMLRFPAQGGAVSPLHDPNTPAAQ
jgi:hypothetical protein